MLDIRIDDLTSAEIADFLEQHIRDMKAVSPPESKHALDLDGLRKPEITFWTVWNNNMLVGCGALKELDATHGEIKSMRTSPLRRRSGVATAMLQHILREAEARGYSRVSLETGSMPFFEPARKLYRRFGFRECEPFADYRRDPNSAFFTKEILQETNASHLAQVNIARMKSALDSPVMAGFVARLEELNALADTSPGFVWRLQTGDGNATYVRPYDDDRIIFNLSVWESLEDLRAYVYRSAHVEVLRNRHEWFEAFQGAFLALWWVPPGHQPSVDEAKKRLAHLAQHGPTSFAFTFKAPFPPID